MASFEEVLQSLPRFRHPLSGFTGVIDHEINGLTYLQRNYDLSPTEVTLVTPASMSPSGRAVYSSPLTLEGCRMILAAFPLFYEVKTQRRPNIDLAISGTDHLVVRDGDARITVACSHPQQVFYATARTASQELVIAREFLELLPSRSY